MQSDKVTGRRQTREWMIQFLFQMDFNPEQLTQALADFWEEKAPRKKKNYLRKRGLEA